MMRLPLYQVDAFAEDVFQGNPAAVCPLPDWPSDETLQAIAAENNLSETAFLLPEEDPVPLRWFTPREEVPLCGHATLAAAFVVLTFLAPDRDAVTFASRGGPLRVSRDDDGRFALDFPALRTERADAVPEGLREAMGVDFADLRVNHEDPNYFAILDGEARVADLRPDLRTLETLHPYGVAVSAPGTSTDFVSRYFAPGYGIPEDPVTGSIHCALGPYWGDRLGRASLTALQLSYRQGRLSVELREGRVILVGGAACYLTGEIRLPPSL